MLEWELTLKDISYIVKQTPCSFDTWFLQNLRAYFLNQLEMYSRKANNTIEINEAVIQV